MSTMAPRTVLPRTNARRLPALRSRRAVTLMELMITVIAIGVIAALAIPSYRRTVERARSNEAVTNLNIISMGEKIYKIDNSTYWADGVTCSGVACATINSKLNVDVTSQFYSLQVTGGGVAYTARADRIGGTKWYTVDQTGAQVSGGSF